MRPRKIISGGQHGAALAALKAARAINIATGGYAPKGWKVEGYDGLTRSNPGLAEFGLIQNDTFCYLDRAIKNIKISNGTVWFGTTQRNDGTLIINAAVKLKKPVIINPSSVELFNWVARNNIQVLNVAGNTCSPVNVRIYGTVYRTIIKAFGCELII